MDYIADGQTLFLFISFSIFFLLDDKAKLIPGNNGEIFKVVF